MNAKSFVASWLAGIVTISIMSGVHQSQPPAQAAAQFNIFDDPKYSLPPGPPGGATLGANAGPSRMQIMEGLDTKFWGDYTLIEITGPIEKDYGEKFLALTKEIKRGDVILSSAGGDLRAGIIIGTQIHAKGFATTVNAGAACLSSCANIWLAGTPRTQGPNSIIAFHAPYLPGDPSHADGEAAALQGIYLATLGYSYATVLDLFGHDPTSVRAYIGRQDGTRTIDAMICTQDADRVLILDSCKADGAAIP